MAIERLSAALDLLTAVERYLTRAVAVEEAARAECSDFHESGCQCAIAAALASLPTNPLEPVRALLHEAGRSLDLAKEGL